MDQIAQPKRDHSIENFLVTKCSDDNWFKDKSNVLLLDLSAALPLGNVP